MSYTIKQAAVIGANGTMGALTGGILAQNGINVSFISRTVEKSQKGLQKAIGKARSECLKKNVTCHDYSELDRVIPQADLIIECLSENIDLKLDVYETIDRYRREDAVVGSMTSSLPLSDLSRNRSESFRKHFLGTHLFNPPTKMLLCEIAPQEDTDEDVTESISQFMEQVLKRVVVHTSNTPGYAGNRIAFLFFSEVTRLAAETGVDVLDYLLGPFTGRAMPPFATIDLVGIDTYKAIINSLISYTDDAMHDKLIIPDFIERLVARGSLGNKTPEKGGFYRRDFNKNISIINLRTLSFNGTKKLKMDPIEKAKDLVHVGKYREAFETLKANRSPESDIVLNMLCLYVAYAFCCVTKVMNGNSGIEGINKVMMFGFNWASPLDVMQVLGGKYEVMDLMNAFNIYIPDTLKEYDDTHDHSMIDGRYFSAR